MADEDADFVGYGTAVEQIADDESLSRYASENKLKAQKVKDKQGRERFHGAFTGGYSAGYYNTVGTAEGWTPSTFTSRKTSRKADDSAAKSSSNRHRPEDYMDDEDLEQFGIAPRQIQTTDAYRRDGQKSQRAAWDPVVPGLTQAITDIVKPVHLSAAVKLLRLMGWKYGQGIGPRVKRKHKHPGAHDQRVLGPALPSAGYDLEDGSDKEDDEFVSHVTFAPKDMNPISFDAKDDLHGIGYSPLNIKQKSKSSSVEEERLTFGGHSQGISGKAFGVGIEEDEDDLDIYSKDKMSDYDMSLADEPQDLHKFTKPRDKKSQPLFSSGATLEGFCIAKKQDKPCEKYTLPELPRGYRPKAAITGVSELPKLYGKLDKTLRGLLIGETAKDAGLLLPDDETKKAAPLLPGKSAELNLNEEKAHVDQQYEEGDLPLAPVRSTEPLNKQSIDFKPFPKNPEKQSRYERYLLLKRSGDRDAYGKCAPPEYDSHERAREREEFERSGKFFKDLSGVMAHRFTRSKQTDEEDDSKVSVRVDEEMGDMTDTKQQAVQMKMFGQMTRESYEWHPHRILCRRFNIPDPYPDSRLVGLPTVQKDKISAYNFLDVESLTKTPEELKAMDEARYENYKENSDKGDESETAPGETGPKSLADGDKAPLDLFKAVFQDTDDDSDSESESDEEENEKQGTENKDGTPDKSDNQTKSSKTLDSIASQYSQSRSVSSMYESVKSDTGEKSDPNKPAETEGDSPIKIKFVPKKDRYKSETKQKKSRWSSDDTKSTLMDVVTDGIANPETLDQSSNEPAVPNETVKASSDNGAVTAEMPGTAEQREIPSPGNLEASEPSASGNVEVEVHTPPSEQEDDEDAWMPALPPTLPGGISGTVPATMPYNGSRDKKSKHKDQKHKKKKSKKSHKDHKAKRR